VHGSVVGAAATWARQRPLADKFELVVLLATAVTSPHLAAAAAIVYVLAYTFQLGLSLFVYFGSTR